MKRLTTTSAEYTRKKTRYGTANKKNLGFGNPFTKKAVYVPPANNLISRVKRAFHQLESAHHSIWEISPTVLTDGTLYTSSLFTEIAQGTSQYTRIGDEIFVEAIKVRLRINGSAATSPVVFRFMCVKSGIECAAGLSGAWTTGATGIGPANVWLNTATVDPATNGIVDPKKVTVLYDGVFKTQEYIAAQVDTNVYEFTIPCKFKHSYNPSNSGYAKMKQIYFLCAAYQFNSTPGTTTVGTINYTADIIFKNSN